MKTRYTALALAFCLALPAIGCARAGNDEAPAAAAPVATTVADGDMQLAKTSPAAADRPAAQRKLIQNAELHVEVDNYDAARHELETELAALGGYIADANIEHRDGKVSRATLKLRVPAEQLHSFLGAAAGSGTVVHESLRTQDITDGYVDLKARLDNARRLEGRLLALMSERATGMKELLEVERELARVRGEIEQYEGKLRTWDKQVAMATVEMQLLTRQVYVAATPPTLGSKLGDALGDSFGTLVALGQGLLLLATVLLPWLLPLALVAFGIRAIVRRLRRTVQPPMMTPDAAAQTTAS